MILVDTNVLVYAINLDAPQHEASRAFLEAIRSKKLEGVLVIQVLLEFFAIITDQKRAAQPLTPESAWQQIDALRSFMPVLGSGDNLIDVLQEIAGSRKGPDIFDSYLAAQMKALGISVLCTYNKKDFTGYENVIVKSPDEFLETAES